MSKTKNKDPISKKEKSTIEKAKDNIKAMGKDSFKPLGQTTKKKLYKDHHKTYGISFPEDNDPLDMILGYYKSTVLHWVDIFHRLRAKHGTDEDIFFEETEIPSKESKDLYSFFDFPFKEKNGKLVSQLVYTHFLMLLAIEIYKLTNSKTISKQIMDKLREVYFGDEKDINRYYVLRYFLYYPLSSGEITNLYIFNKDEEFIPRVLTQDQYHYYCAEQEEPLRNAIVVNLNDFFSKVFKLPKKKKLLTSFVVTEDWERDILYYIREEKYSNINITFGKKHLSVPTQVELVRPLTKSELLFPEIVAKQSGYGSCHLEFDAGKAKSGTSRTRVKFDKNHYPAWKNMIPEYRLGREDIIKNEKKRENMLKDMLFSAKLTDDGGVLE